MRSLTYKQIKWLILLIPTVTVGLWEYIRHTPAMLNVLSMEAGNWLTPVIVFVVTMLFMRKLFEMMEDMRRKLEEERAMKIMLEEREKIARQLHDGIAQSLFLLSVKMNQWESKEPDIEQHAQYQKIRKTVQHIHEDVRQSIYNLRHPSVVHSFPWTESLKQVVVDFRKETGIDVQFDWNLPEDQLTDKEKIELYACIKECLMNVRKHADADNVRITGEKTADGWCCTVKDNGVGFTNEAAAGQDGYGMEIMQDRARAMGWHIRWERDEGTVVTIRKEAAKR